ncbi:MAG: glycosyltransferase [Actinomycetota bacterium]|nr:glycosyltransferase [Actinomycetota bacterium]
MARVLVSYWKIQEVSIDEMLCYWDGFVHELRDAGNDVFVINTGYFNPYDSNEVLNQELDELLLEKARAFDPELIITFNNRIPKSFLEEFSDIPIFLWDGDNLIYFCDLPYIEEHKSRYQVISIVQDWRQDYLDFGFKNDQVLYVPLATAIRKADIEQTMAVSFLGIRSYHKSRYYWYAKNHDYMPMFYKLVEAHLNEANYNYEELFERYFGKDYPELVLSQEDLYPLFNYRWLVLANMLDLGLTISGYAGKWEDAVEYMPQLVAAYDPQLVWTLEDNARFYNASKVSLCPIAPQAQGSGFSWRVLDIMASNACLLVSRSTDLQELTRDFIDLPMFDTPWEARDLAKQLLGDDTMRREIVEASQRYVDENARWIHRFRQIQDATGIAIASEDQGEHKLFNVMLDDPDVRALLEQYGDAGIRKPVPGSNVVASSNLSGETKSPRLLGLIEHRVRPSDVLSCFTLGLSLAVLGLIVDAFLSVIALAVPLEVLGVLLMLASLLLVGTKFFIWRRRRLLKAQAEQTRNDSTRR